MTKLPDALAPWSESLSIFAPEIASALEPLLERLAAALGPVRPARPSIDEEPNGFAGLTRRGHYDRLLLSEWLLADELPDEFLRRAASAEHMFLEVDRRTPARGRASVALLDAGPSQLGSPRIAHIALLIVLARRAAAARAAFHWGVLQDAALSLFSDVTPTSLFALLGARTTKPPTGFLDRRIEQLAEIASPAARDVFVVGGREAKECATSLGASFVRIEDVLEPSVRQVSVSLEDVSARRLASVRLELPESRVATQLLRDPFKAAPASTPREKLPVDPTSLVLSPGGLKVFFRAGDDVVWLGLPNSPRASFGNPKWLCLGAPVIAVGVVRRKMIAISSKEEQRLLSLFTPQGCHPLGHFTRTERVHAPWVDGEEPLRGILVSKAASVPALLYRDSRDWLFSYTETHSTRMLIARSVLATATLRCGAAFIALDVRQRSLEDRFEGPAVVTVSGDGERKLFALPKEDVEEALLSADLGSSDDRGVVWASRWRGGRWLCATSSSRDAPVEVATPEGARAIAVLPPRDKDNGPSVLWVGADGHSVGYSNKSLNGHLLDVTSPVVRAIVDDHATTLALVTRDSEVVFYSLYRRQIVGRLNVEALGR